MTRTLLHDSVEINVTPESFREEDINGNVYPFIDVLMLPFDKVSRNGALYRKDKLSLINMPRDLSLYALIAT